MTDPWSREADYQMSEALFISMLKKGLLKQSEFDQCLALVKEGTRPPLTLLSSNPNLKKLENKLLHEGIKT